MNKRTLRGSFFIFSLFTFYFSLLLIGCGGDDGIIYKPSSHILPSHIKKIAIRPFVNKTQQFALEDKLTREIYTRFVTNGTYKITNEADANGILTGEINRYIHFPVAYDANLIATSYKLEIVTRIGFVDKASNQYLWQESNMVGNIVYPSPTLPGGMTEEEAREIVWQQLSKDMLKRTIEGFGSVGGESERKISPDTPKQQKKATEQTETDKNE
ncbi:LptE family protein [Elusimicrobiota bacterium]